MKKISVLALLALVASPAFADIASTTYVGAVKTNLEANIDTKLDEALGDTNKDKALVTTGTNGAVQPGTVASGMIDADAVVSGKIADSAVVNSKVASGIGINKLNLPTKCTSNKSCMLIYNSAESKFVWEEIGRGSDSAPTGGVDGSGSNPA